MSEVLPVVWLVRHGETAWSRDRRHTGRTDVPLTERGEQTALDLAERLLGVRASRVYTSPLKRAVATCTLAGFGAAAEQDPDLIEWDYGRFEGLTSGEIRAQRPGWSLFRDGCEGGETVSAVAARADRVVARLRAAEGDALVFSSGHFLRVLAVRWLGLEPAAGRYLVLGTAALCTLGYDHDLSEPAIRLWNQLPPSAA